MLCLIVILGYPQREIELYDLSSTLLTLNIQSGDTIILEELSPQEKRRRMEERTSKVPSSGDSKYSVGR